MKKRLKEVVVTSADAVVTGVSVGKEIVDLVGIYIDDMLLDELIDKAKSMNKNQFKSYLYRKRLSDFYDELESYCKE